MNLTKDAIVTPQISAAALTAVMHGSISGLACKCSLKNDMDFLIKHDRIVCGCCAREVAFFPPLLGVYKASCTCCASPSIKTTFVVDSRGVYTCTWCGRTR